MDGLIRIPTIRRLFCSPPPLPLPFSFMMYRNRLILSAEYDYHDSLFLWVTG